MFWQWPSYAHQSAMSGHPPWFASAPPAYKVSQREEKSPESVLKIKAKFKITLGQGYISKGDVSSLMSYFSVPKGDTDLQLVYDASKSGWNSSLWVPRFVLLSPETLTDLLTAPSWMADVDLGEFFFVFPP
jgi:hypothetical protein